jgi:hypothetical protein
MAPPGDAPKPKPVLSLSSEPKARGANRSTKVAGKLKVLPDQPVSDAPVVPSTSASAGFSPPPRAGREDIQTREQQSTESSDEEDSDSEVEAQQEEVRPGSILGPYNHSYCSIIGV